MSTKSFQVLFTSRLREGKDRRKSIALLAERFQLDFRQIRLLLASKNHVVKHCVERTDAEKLVAAFAQAGWIACIKELEPDIGIEAGKPLAGQETALSREIYSVDETSVLMVPEHWEPMRGLNRGAIIQAGSLENNEFCVVLSQNVSLPDNDASVENYCSAQLQQCVRQVVDGVVATPATKISLRKGAVFSGEITAKIDSVPVGYLVACLRARDQMITLFLWCEKREYERKKSLLMRVALNFAPCNSTSSSAATREAGNRAANVVPLH